MPIPSKPVGSSASVANLPEPAKVSPRSDYQKPPAQAPASPGNDYQSPYLDLDFEEMLYARHVEIENLQDLEKQRGTPTPALFNQFYKFVQNPSSVSVETFKRMIDTDDTIGSGVDFLTTCLAARIGRYVHSNEEITERVNKVLDQLQGGFVNTIKELLSATWAGFFVGEKVYADDPELGFIPRKVVGLPPSTVLFEIERDGELSSDGILQYQRNMNPMNLGRGVGFFGGVANGLGFGGAPNRPDVFAKLGDLPYAIRTGNTFNYMSVRIPKQKCLHFAFDAQGKFRNPYGRSLLRRCYKYYVTKDAILQMMAIALDRKGTPLLVVYYDANAQIYDGTVPVNKDGKKTPINPGEAAKKAFSNTHNDSVIYLPGRKDGDGSIYQVDPIPQSPNTQDFITALEFCNKSILRALLIPSLMFGDGQGGYALGEVHRNVFDQVLDGMLAGAKEVLLQQLVKDILQLNYPESAWKPDGLGDFTKRELSQEEQDKVMTTFEKGINAGIIDTQDINDLNKMRESIGFQVRKTPIEGAMVPGFEENGVVKQDQALDAGLDGSGKPVQTEEQKADGNPATPPPFPGAKAKPSEGQDDAQEPPPPVNKKSLWSRLIRKR